VPKYPVSAFQGYEFAFFILLYETIINFSIAFKIFSSLKQQNEIILRIHLKNKSTNKFKKQ